jgi:allantoinase
MSTRPAELVGLAHKGRIAPGCEADLCVFAPEETFVVDAGKLHHRNRVSAYHGRALTGVVRGTWLRGREVTGTVPHGRLLSNRSAA